MLADLRAALTRRNPGFWRADASVLTSGFGSVGYPKLVSLALAEADRDLAFSDQNASSVSDEVRDGGLVDPDVCVVEAAVGEDWFVPSTSLGQDRTGIATFD